MSSPRCIGTALVLGLAFAWGAQADELTYRDALGDRPSTDEPLIPPAAVTPSPARREAPADHREGHEDSGDLIPLAVSRGSEAAQIYQRNQRRIAMLTELFDRLKREASAEAQGAAESEADRRRQEEGMKEMLEGQASTGAPAAASPDELAPATAPVPDETVAARPEPAAPAAVGADGTYVVAKGDSLVAISRKVYGDPTVWKQLAAANGLDQKSVLKVGTRLRVPPRGHEGAALAALPAPAAPGPGPASAGTPPALAPAAPGVSSGPTGASAPMSARRRAAAGAPDEPVLDYSRYEYKLYSIQNGDTLSSIAARFLGDASQVALIKSANQPVVQKGLRAGEKLLIPIPKSQAHQDRYLKSKEGVFD